MKCLITGAEGFIGSHLVEDLMVSGHDVTAYTLYNSFATAGLNRPGFYRDPRVVFSAKAFA